MTISNITTTVLSSLDGSTSLAPIFIKETANTAGRTILADKAGGEHEAREKFIEEFGTGAIWLGGIPACRWIFDKTVFKHMGLDPNISIQKLPDAKNKNPQQLTIKKLEEYSQKAGVKGARLVKKYKNAHIAKFLTTTLIPFALLTVVLPKFNQNLSRKIILERAAQEEKSNSKNHDNYYQKPERILAMPLSFQKAAFHSTKSPNLRAIEENFIKNTSKPVSFSGNEKADKKPAFSGIGTTLLNAATSAQIDPVNNMMLLDLGISGNRVTFVPRNNQERIEYGIKEGGFVFFIFFAQKLMQKGFDKIAQHFGTPIDLDFKTLDSKEFKQGMAQVHKTQSVPERLTQFAKKSGKSGEDALARDAYDFIQVNHNKSEFLTLHTAKQTGVVKTTDKAKQVLDAKKYIEIKDVKKLSDNIGDFAKAMLKSGKSSEQFIKKAKTVKASFLITNLAICSGVLGYVLPKIQYVYRKKVYGSDDFPGIQGYLEEAKHLNQTA